MKCIAGYICLVLFFGCGICVAQDSYKERIFQMVDRIERPAALLESNTIDFTNFDAWYKDFKKASDSFEQDFIKGYKQKESFKLAQKSLDGFSLAWSMLSQAKYSDVQYKESLALDAVSDAHKWKNAASDKRKKATETISQAIKDLKKAREALAGEE